MITLFRLLREASSGTAIYPEHVLEEILLRDNPLDIENLSFSVGSETTYTQEWGGGGGGVWCRLRIKPQRLAADSANGSAPMLNWLVEEKQITPHIPVIDKSKREEPSS